MYYYSTGPVTTSALVTVDSRVYLNCTASTSYIGDFLS